MKLLPAISISHSYRKSANVGRKFWLSFGVNSLMESTHWSGLEQGLRANGLQDIVWLRSHYTGIRTGPGPLFWSQSTLAYVMTSLGSNHSKVSFTCTVNITVHCSHFMLFTHKVKKIRGAPHKNGHVGDTCKRALSESEN